MYPQLLYNDAFLLLTGPLLNLNADFQLDGLWNMLPRKLCVKELFFILEVCLPFSGMDVHIFNLKMIQTNLIIVTIIILDLPLILGEHIVGSMWGGRAR